MRALFPFVYSLILLTLADPASGQVTDVPATPETLAKAGIELKVTTGRTADSMTYFCCEVRQGDSSAESVILYVQKGRGGRTTFSIRAHAAVYPSESERTTYVAEMDLPSGELKDYFLRIYQNRGMDMNAYVISFAELLDYSRNNENKKLNQSVQ